MRAKFSIFSAVFGLQVACASALTIQLDYTYDASTDNFFAQNATARAAVERAATDLSAALTGPLNPVATDQYTGTNGSTSLTFDWALLFENPSVEGSQIRLDNFAFSNDVVTIFVGMRPLLGTTLGEGGPAGVAFSARSQGPSNTINSELPGAVDAAEAASNIAMTRGAGPVTGSLNGSFSVPDSSYDLRYGALAGTLWFDNDTNNDGIVDTAATLANSWHFNAASSVATGKNDFYSVALHEMLHAIGYGVSDTWESNVSSTSWLGPNAVALNNGSGANLLSSDSAHLRSGLVSPRLTDGVLQEVVMDPTLTVGSRKLLTQMDFAILRDLGYTTVPEPATAALLAIGGVALLSRRTHRRTSRYLL